MANPANAMLVITDGTGANTASMLVTVNGAHLNEWSPKTPQAGTLIWASSPYVDGKHLISKTYDNIVDAFDVVIKDANQDEVIRDLRKFLVLLERAIEYWTDEYNTHKFWLEVRGSCETNTRYAIAVNYVEPDIPYPFDAPSDAAPNAIMDDIQLIIEHTIWTDNLTIGANCVKIAAGRDEYIGDEYDTFVPVLTADDAYTEDPATFDDNSDLYIGAAPATGNNYRTGIRFRNVTIPAGSTITAAYIDLFPVANKIGTTVKIIIKGEKSINPTAFISYADLTGRVTTTAQVVNSNVEAWFVPPADIYRTDDISTIIQEIINQGGWVSGQDLVILIFDNGSDAGAERIAGDTDDAVYSEPILHVSWRPADTVVPHGELIPTCLRAPMVVPYWNGLALTHAYWNDVSTGAWSDNLVDIGMVDDSLLPPAPAVGDCLYVGIMDVWPADPGSVFTNLIINLAVKSVDITSISTAISDGAGGWIAHTLLYNSICPLLPAADIGLNYMSWPLVAGWKVDTIHGVPARWLKFEVTGVGAAPTPPEKSNAYPLYSVMWPHIEITGDEIHGDIRGILDFLISCANGPGMSNLIVSARKVSRTNSDQFVPYIALTHFQKAPDAIVYDDPMLTPTEIENSEAYAGWCTNWTEAGAQPTQYIKHIQLELKTYSGRYRVLLRSKVNVGAAGTIGLNLRFIGPVAGSYDTLITYNEGTGKQLFDFGLISFPSETLLSSNTAWVDMYIRGVCTAAIDIDLYDLVIMPVDEAYLEIAKQLTALPDLDQSQQLDYIDTLDMDYPIKAITSDFKLGPYAQVLINNTGAGYLTVNWAYPVYMLLKATILGSFNLEADEAYWLIFFIYDSDAEVTESYFQYLLAPVLDKNQRYLLARGDE